MSHKFFTYTSLFTLIFTFAFAQAALAATADDFVFEVTITNGADTTFTIPTTGVGYNYDVDWDNNEVFEDTENTTDATNDFGSTGTYTVRVTGDFPRIYFNNSGDKEKITDIIQWGTNPWTSMNSAFYGATNLDISATDTPNLSAVADFSNMFNGADGLQDRVGTFESEVEYVAPDGAQATNAGDINNDGYADFVMNGSDGWRVYLNDGDGTFTVSALNNEYTKNVRSTDLVDINLDGNLDFLLPDFSGLFHIFYGNGDGTFQAASTHTGVGNNLGATAGDLDNDGDIDVTTAHWSGSSVAVMLNNGDGTFATPVEYGLSAIGPRKISIADFDGDGYNDMVVSIDGGAGGNVLLNNGDGTFADYVLYSQGTVAFTRGNAVGDVDNDGDIDIALANHGSSNFTVFLNNGDGTFSNGSIVAIDNTGPNAEHVELADLNGDGYLDGVISFGAGGGTRVAVLLNDGDGTFSAFTYYSVGGSVQTLDLADFDNDGNIDIVAPDANNDQASVFFNKNTGLNNWDISFATTTASMFKDATFNQGLANWDTSSVVDMSHMFDGNTTFNQDLSSWDVSAVTDMTDMFDGVTLSTDNYDNLLEGWNALSLQSSVTFNGGNATYCYGESERQSMVNGDSWTITDGGKDCTNATVRIVLIDPATLSSAPSDTIKTTCKLSDTTITTDEEVDIEVSASMHKSKLPYTFKWTNDMTGDDQDFSHTFDTPGTYILRGMVENNERGEQVVRCEDITVTEAEEDTSSSSGGSSSDTDDADEDTTEEDTSSVSNTATVATPIFTTSLSNGSEEQSVKELQTLLNNINFTLAETGAGSPGNETNYYGALTTDAVTRFQETFGVTPADGTLNQQTRDWLNLIMMFR